MDKFSEEFNNYVKKIVNETGREILVQQTEAVPVTGMGTCIREHPTLIFIEISPDMDQRYLFKSCVAHIATRGLLKYGRGYCSPIPRRLLTRVESDSLDMLVAMIEDIVVNKIVQENGVEFYDPDYPEAVRLETEAMRKNEDIYGLFPDPTLKERFMIFRYIQAWGLLQFCKLEEIPGSILRQFEADFRTYRPEQYIEAAVIKEMILRNDIFTAEGEKKIIEDVMKLWWLEGIATFESWPKRKRLK